MKIREPEKEDIEDINELSKKSWIEGFRDLLTEEEIRNSREKESYLNLDKLQEESEIDKLVSLVAERDDEVIGRVKIFWGDKNVEEFVNPNQNEAQVRGMYVHPDHWRTGVGSSLLEEATSRIPKEIDFLVVETFKDDERAKNFYRKNGFSKSDEREKGPEEISTLEEKKETVVMKNKL